jgi:hypothetical protein
MSNIETLAEFERPLWKDNPKNELVGLGVHPSSPASDEASSSTELAHFVNTTQRMNWWG